LSDDQRPRSELTREEQIASDLEWHRREVDPKENEETTPPDEESIETCCIWVTECYPPSQAAGLVSGLRKLGWDKRQPWDPYGYSAVGWLERERGNAYAGAWLNLGRVVREGQKRRFLGSDIRETVLPEGIDYADAYVQNLLPSLTVLTVQFVLDDRGARYVEETARTMFETRTEKVNDSYYFATVANQKKEATRETRAELRARCNGWVREHVPGLFSVQEQAAPFPTCELLIFDKAQPFERTSGGREEYLWILDVEHEMDAWKGINLPTVRLSLPSWFDEDELALVLAANREEIASNEDLSPYGGKTRHGMAAWLYHSAGGLMSVWALHAVLRVYERRLASLRDSIGEIDIGNPEEASHRVQHSQSWLIGLSTDLLPLTSELADLCGKKDYFLRLVPEFESMIEYPWGKLNFVEIRREDLSRRSLRTRELEGELREVVMTVGAVVGAVSQERSSQANLRLQGRLTFLTWVLVALTIVLVVIGAATIWVSL